MVSFSNVGGSLTGAIILVALGYTFRVLRLARPNTKQKSAAAAPPAVHRWPRHVCKLSPAAVRLLIETKPLPALVVEICNADGTQRSAWMPQELLQQVLQATADELAQGITSMAKWDSMLAVRQQATTTFSYPDVRNLLVLVCQSEELLQPLLSSVADAGLNRCAVCVASSSCFASESLLAVELQYISRDVLHVMLQLGSSPCYVPGLVIDVRRRDERLLYGAPPNTVHIAADLLASELALPPDQFMRRHGVQKPLPNDVVVLFSRTGRRAAWASQVAADAGLSRVYVYKQGTWGWRLHASVKPYRQYQQGDAPPDPELFQVEPVYEVAALEEIVHRLGWPVVEGKLPARHTVLSLHGMDDLMGMLR